MKVFERYFERNTVSDPVVFEQVPEVIVIIPVLNDRDIFITLAKLTGCSCKLGNAGVVIVVNHAENSDERVKAANRELVAELRDYICAGVCRRPEFSFQLIEAFDLPAKFAGVGLARKIAMDAAALFFYRHDKVNAPILSLDADTWVEDNYLDETIRFFRSYPVAGVSLAYGHRLEELAANSAVCEAMIKYELYLRYYQQALEYCGHPYAFHCIGSAFAVRTADYVAQGGMNKRQAGEDFYFLQKLIATGRFAALKTVKVHPSARFSNRTPFGTGQSVRQIVENKGVFPVYHWQAFKDLKKFLVQLPRLYKADDAAVADYCGRQASGMKAFLEETAIVDLVAEVNANCASEAQFVKRFYDGFNAFRVLKYLNYVHDNYYLKTDIHFVLQDMFRDLEYPFSVSGFENLNFLRNL